MDIKALCLFGFDRFKISSQLSFLPKPAESVAVRLMMMDMEEIILCHGDGPP